ncbi:MAG TPA: lytic transglycosylase domain-containing protein [Flavisolibacter sp.]|nr:lytic transglycosylase domain-containing protein [Flavisolibacter sp.]
MKQYRAAGSFVLGALFSLFLFSQFAFKKNEQPGARWTSPAMPAQLSFAGEKVPVERWDVKEKFDRELLMNYYSPGTIIYLMKLANRNFPIISARLKANGVPDDFKYLCIAESNMQSWAISKSGAVGYWQFMDGTAPGYGLETTSQVDQRQDLERATDAACKYLKQAYARFGNWTAAAASYNCGQAGYNNQAGFQRTVNYYDLHLPEETNKYIFRILAFKYLLENSGDLGFAITEEEKYKEIPSRSVTITSSIPDLAQYAISNGTSYKVLKLMNPWIKGRSLTVAKGRSYELKLPE